MTLDAKAHFEAVRPQAIRFSNLPMAAFASNLLFYMALMVKDHMFRNMEYLAPGCRRICIVVLVFFQDLGVVGDDVIVAVQAFFHRRQARVQGVFHIRVTVITIDGLDPRVQLVAEGNRLLRGHVPVG
jgi:hypothetical protein